MQLHLSTWPEVEKYLEASRAIIIPIGSTEQHGPNGLLGTDAICPELIARRAGDEAGFLIGPTFNVGQAQHHMAFPGTITLRPSTMIAAMADWAASLSRHGFERIYWLNGHGGNVNTINAAFAEIYHGVSFDRAGANHPTLRCTLRNWWELSGVMDLCRQLFPVGEGHHATPSEVSVTYFAYPTRRSMWRCRRKSHPWARSSMRRITAAASPMAASAPIRRRPMSRRAARSLPPQ